MVISNDSNYSEVKAGGYKSAPARLPAQARRAGKFRGHVSNQRNNMFKTKKSKIIIITGLILLTLAIFQYWLNYNLASAKLARLVKAAPEIKKQYQLDKLSLVLPAQDENSVQVAVGDPGAKTFTPDLTISRWNNEVSLKIKPSATEECFP